MPTPPAALSPLTPDARTLPVIVIGAGPAGLMAAEVLSAAGICVDVFDAMPSAGRKFLLAGRGGLNLAHAEPLPRQVERYASRAEALAPLLQAFGPDELRAWAHGLGIETFVGSSGRVFPTDMKSAPLLRAWLARLRHPPHGGAPVRFHMRHRWTGWAAGMGEGDDAWTFDAPQGSVAIRAQVVVLALGGASWPRLGSDGAWAPLLHSRRVDVAPLLPSNCGFDVGDVAADQPGWSEFFKSRFAGQPFKSVALTFTDRLGRHFHQAGEFVVTDTGIEGSLVYAASALLRDEIAATGHATFHLDLLPGRTLAQVHSEVAHPRGSRSLASHLKSRLRLDGIKSAILHELLPKSDFADTERLSEAIKALPISLCAARPIAEAISTAGGVRFEAMTDELMLQALPGVYCAGEMLDWEAPTGGYLLAACFSTGRAAGLAAVERLRLSEATPAG